MIEQQTLDSVPPDNELLDAFSWRLLLAHFDRPRVLSINPPTVGHLDALATLFGSVTSLEQEPSAVACGEEAGFAAREKIFRVAGNSLSLPFSDESFDLVIVNEGVAVERGKVPIPELQSLYATLLNGLRRVLTTNGCVCLCTRNRWDYRQLLAGNGNEENVRPWKLAALIRNYRRLSHQCLSPRQYATALREAGFSGIRTYIAFPDFVKPRFIVPFEASIYRYYRHHFTYPQGSGPQQLLARLVARTGIDRFLESHVLITGAKS